MEHINTVKTSVVGIAGIIGSVAAKMLGGWDAALQTLIIFMAIDYITGLIVAGVFHKSEKSETGALESRAGWKGLCRKGMTLLIVLVANQLDIVAGTDVIRNAAIIAYIVNETISIIENAGLMGLPIPTIIKKALDLLQKQAEESEVK
jgi:toxin secretion/phage lysis holin